MSSATRRICKECGGTFTEVFYEKADFGKSSYQNRRAVCRGCRQSRRDEVKRRNRPLKKAQSAIKTHAPKLINKGLIASEEELIVRFGWDAVQMARDIENAFGGDCPYCCESFATMPHGLSDVTLDVIDPARSPYYKTNVKWVCATCNRAKSTSSADAWAETLAMWAQWKKHQTWLATQPKWAQGKLFDD